MAQYCPLPGQFLAIARQETTRREEAEDRRRKKVREGGREKKIAEERKRLLSLLLFTLHQIVWNPDKHWGCERWRVGSTLHPPFTHPSPFREKQLQEISGCETPHHWWTNKGSAYHEAYTSFMHRAGHNRWPNCCYKLPIGNSKTEVTATSRRVAERIPIVGWRVVKGGEGSAAPFTRTITYVLDIYTVLVKGEGCFWK